MITREPSVTVYGWVDPITGAPARRGRNAIKFWKYTTGKFGEEDILFFAVPGIKTQAQALEMGYRIVSR